jgi:hypothetical protein
MSLWDFQYRQYLRGLREGFSDEEREASLIHSRVNLQAAIVKDLWSKVFSSLGKDFYISLIKYQLRESAVDPADYDSTAKEIFERLVEKSREKKHRQQQKQQKQQQQYSSDLSAAKEVLERLLEKKNQQQEHSGASVVKKQKRKRPTFHNCSNHFRCHSKFISKSRNANSSRKGSAGKRDSVL